MWLRLTQLLLAEAQHPLQLRPACVRTGRAMSVSSQNKVVLGLQWGDEGKGKVIDVLAGSTDFVVRCQGGANAGHTVVNNGKKTILHLLPSGALHEDAVCVIGNGVVVDPVALDEELKSLNDMGVMLQERLRISDRAHMVLPYHKLIDAANEKNRGDKKVGTTLRGIGPCYGDKMSRQGLRCGHVVREDFSSILRQQMESVNKRLQSLGAEGFDIDAMHKEVLPFCEAMRPMVCDTVDILHKAVAQDACMLFEGAQGVMLDIDYGTYPFVTSSNTGIGGVITGSGLNHKNVGEIIGIVKAYTTRVGEGPFPTELDDAGAEELRQRGGEFGATTGRPRRTGWLDLVVIGFACRLNGMDTIALTKLDVLSTGDDIQVCVAYNYNGQRIDTVPANIEDLAKVEPIYETLPGWSEDITGCRSFDALPANAQAYVRFIEERTGVRVGYIGVGPDREETIVCSN